MATSTANNNNINTNVGTGLTSTLNQVFDSHPYINQVFTKEVRQCAIDNMMSACDNPPSLTQINSDINKADSILEFLILNDVFDRETKIFQFETIIRFLKVKKCINGQYPCWADESYQENKKYIDDFQFVSS